MNERQNRDRNMFMAGFGLGYAISGLVIFVATRVLS